MSRAGDLLIEEGPFEPGTPTRMWIGPVFVGTAALNELRAELIELRESAPSAPDPCTAETHSWSHFQSEQIDSYWIRCTEWAPHKKHKDAHTGLTWFDAPEEAS